MNWEGYAKELYEALKHRLSCTIKAQNCLTCRDGEDLIANGRMLECPRCEGSGQIKTECHDPQCGDSTWDHNCGMGFEKCRKCHGQKTVASLELMHESRGT